MTLIASDGYEYEDLTQRLLGNPKDSERNDAIKSVRGGGYPEGEVRAFIEAHDKGRGPYYERIYRGWSAISRMRERTTNQS